MRPRLARGTDERLLGAPSSGLTRATDGGALRASDMRAKRCEMGNESAEASITAGWCANDSMGMSALLASSSTSDVRSLLLRLETSLAPPGKTS